MHIVALAVLYLAHGSGAKLTSRDPKEPLGDYFVQLRLLLAEILYTTPVDRCFAVITDDAHYAVFEKSVFVKPRLNFFLRIPDWEDLLAPNYQTVKVLKEIRTQNCDLHLVLLANGHQMRRFMVFLDDYRVLNTRAKYVLFHDNRILTKDTMYIWRNVVQAVFLRWTSASKDVPYRGQETMKSYRLYMSTGFLIGFIASLSIPSILNIISCTGQSSSEKNAYRRYIATIMHTLVWYTEPLHQQSKLWQSILLVRKAHFRSSHLCMQKQIGRITQRDLAITQFCLIGFPMLGAEKIGLNDDRFLESNTYMWRVLGHLLGIKDEYNACAESWQETKPRFELLLKRVVQPALTTAGPEFHDMTAVLWESLRPIHKVFTVDSALFYTRREAGCKGYEVLDADFLDQQPQAVRDKRRFHSLKLWDRLSVAMVVMMFTHLYRITAVRWYLNAVAELGMWFQKYFPYLAIYRYGWSWAYVRLFRQAKNKTH